LTRQITNLLVMGTFENPKFQTFIIIKVLVHLLDLLHIFLMNRFII